MTRKLFLVLALVLAAVVVLWLLWTRAPDAPIVPPVPQVTTTTPSNPNPIPTVEPHPHVPVAHPDPVAARAIDRSRPHLTGSVRGSGNAPLAGAHVRAWFELDEGRRVQGELESDAAGNYALELPDWSALDALERTRARAWVSASADGHQPQKRAFKLQPSPSASVGDAAVVDFVLLAGRALHGRVVDSAGHSVAGAEVALVVKTRVGEREVRSKVNESSSAPDGGFELGFVSTSHVELYLHADNAGAALVQLDLEAGRDRDLGDVPLQGPGELSGVVSFVDGHPVPDLELWAVPEAVANEPTALARCIGDRLERERGEGLFSTHTRTDAQGAFRLRGLMSGRYMLRVPRPEVVIEPRIGYYATPTADIKLSVESFRLRVRALDERGRELLGAHVQLTELNESAGGSYQPGQVWHETIRAPLGCATFDVQPETSYGVRIDAPGRATHEDLVMLAQGEYEQLQEYHLEPRGEPGKVRLAIHGDFGPPRGIQVELVSVLTGAVDQNEGLLECDAQGWLPPLAPGHLLFSIGFKEDANEPNWYFPLRTKEALELAAGQSRELSLTAKAGGRVELELGLQGAPPPGFELALAPELSEALRQKRLAEQLSTRGAYVDATGLDQQPGRRLQFRGPDGGLQSQLLPGTTGQSFDLLEPGRWKLVVQAQGFANGETEVDVVPGRFTRARVDLEAR